MTTEQRQTGPAQDASIEEVIIPVRFHHVNLKAYHFEEMRAFYTALIGIHPVAEVGTLTRNVSVDAVGSWIAISLAAAKAP